MRFAGGKKKGPAIREVSLKKGEADYLLFADGKAIATVEAKPEGHTLRGVELQSEKYIQGLPAGMAAWKNPLPFSYENTGIETHFTNKLDPVSRVCITTIQRLYSMLKGEEELSPDLDEELAYDAAQLDRAVVTPDQIRTVIRAFRDNLFTEIFPGRTDVPKTLIYAKDDSHADDIVKIIREEFGKGNDFCQKITYKTTGVKTDDLIASFRNSYNPRIARLERQLNEKDKARLLQFVEAGALDATRFQAILSRHGLVDVWRKFERQFLRDG